MKTQYMNNVPFLPGEITIVKSDHAEATMKHSSRLANSFRKAGLNVLAINCGMSDRRFKSHYLDTYGEDTYTRPMVVLKTSDCGNVVGDRESIDQIIREAKIGVVILAGWEFSSSNTRRRTNLYYYIRELMKQDITVIVYTQTTGNPVAGKMQVMGKIAAAAIEVVEIDTSKILETIVKKPPVIVWESYEEMDRAEQGVQQLLKNINNLDPHGVQIESRGQIDERDLVRDWSWRDKVGK